VSSKGTKGKGGGKREASVLGSLPATRPSRMGRHRDGDGAATPVRETAIAEVAKAAGKPEPKARPKTKAKAKAQAAPAKPKPRSKPEAAPAAVTEQPSAPAGPRAVRPASPPLAGDVPTDAQRPSGAPPSGAELVTTVVQAAGELAQIGFTVGGQILKRAVDRLPKP